MKTVTGTFDTGAEASYRTVYGRLVFRIIDTTASSDVTMSATSTETISDIDYVNDGVEDSQINYATFEDDSWLLDGSKALMPDSGHTNMGWWSASLSNASTRLYASPIVITADGTSNHTTAGITIIFDEANNEYAEAFTVVYKDSGGSTLETITVTSNTDSRYVDETGVTDWQDIVITITKWSTTNRRARIQEVIFGVVETYTKDNKLLKMDIEEEVGLLSSKLVPDKISFRIFNQNQDFDILAPTGKFASLQKQQTVEPAIGFNNGSYIEYVSLGKYFLDEWGTDRTDLSAHFVGYDRLFLLNQNQYRKGLKPAATDTLGDLVDSVMTDAGLTSSDYNVDSTFGAITTSNFLPTGTHKEVLKHILIAGRGVCIKDENGVLQIKQLGATSTGYTLSKTLMGQYPKINLDKMTYQIDTEVINWVEAAGTTQIFKGTKTLSGTEDVWVKYTSPATNGSASLDVGVLNSATYYTNWAKLNITHTGAVEITIDGKVLTKNILPQETLTGETEGEVKTVRSDLIDTSAMATLVGTWASNHFTDRVLMDTTFRGNPKLEVGDIVDNENEFSDLEDAKIYKINHLYAGGYEQKVRVRGS